MNNLRTTLYKEYSHCLSTLKECSLDTSKNTNEYVSQNEEVVFDFDQIKAEFCKKYNVTSVSSVDGLYTTLNKMYFIEFKNQSSKRLPWPKVKNKIYDSTTILKKDFDFKENEFYDFETFVVVPSVKSSSPSRQKILQHGNDRIQTPFKATQLEIFEKLYNMKCYRITNKDFEKHLGLS